MEKKREISRSDALIAGLSSYFTGNPCKYGHIATRRIKNRECNECRRLYNLLPDRVELVKEYQKKYRNGEVIKENGNWILTNSPEYNIRKYARSRVCTALKTGRLKKLPCIKCGERKTDAHHEDYSKPLDVIWLCRFHHQQRHEELQSTTYNQQGK